MNSCLQSIEVPYSFGKKSFYHIFKEKTVPVKNNKIRLIATLGATRGSREHIYHFPDGSKYTAAYSLGAIAKYYQIDELVIIGTEETKQMLEEYPMTINVETTIIAIPLIKNIEETLYHKAIEFFDFPRKILLDVTQGYRAFPMLTIFAAMFAQHNARNRTRLIDILYASATNPDCSPGQSSCDYEIISLLAYLDSANLSEVIHSFINTMTVPNYPIGYSQFQSLESRLRDTSKALLNNDIYQASKLSKRVLESLGKISRTLPHLEPSFLQLEKDIAKIRKIESEPRESLKLLRFWHYIFEKGIALQAITLIYESITQFVYEYVKNHHISKRFLDNQGEECLKLYNTYQKKNCIKKRLESQLDKLGSDREAMESISGLLFVLDHVRNKAAHAFIDPYCSKKVKLSYKRLGINPDWQLDEQLNEMIDRYERALSTLNVLSAI